MLASKAKEQQTQTAQKPTLFAKNLAPEVTQPQKRQTLPKRERKHILHTRRKRKKEKRPKQVSNHARVQLARKKAQTTQLRTRVCVLACRFADNVLLLLLLRLCSCVPCSQSIWVHFHISPPLPPLSQVRTQTKGETRNRSVRLFAIAHF